MLAFSALETLVMMRYINLHLPLPLPLPFQVICDIMYSFLELHKIFVAVTHFCEYCAA